METEQCIKSRMSVHGYDTSKDVSDSQLKKLFELVKMAPSGYNLQPWEFIVVKDQKNKEKLKECAYGQQHIVDASASVIVLGNKKPGAHADKVFEDWHKKGYMPKEYAEKTSAMVKNEWDNWHESDRRAWSLRSTQLASMTLMLAAWDMGLATCPMEGFEPEKVKKAFGIPDDYDVAMLMTLGYANEKAGERRYRRPFDEITHFEEFGKHPKP